MRDEAADFADDFAADVAAEVRRRVQESRPPSCAFVGPADFDRRTLRVVLAAIRGAGFRPIELHLSLTANLGEGLVQDLATLPVLVTADSERNEAVAALAVEAIASGTELIRLERAHSSVELSDLEELNADSGVRPEVVLYRSGSLDDSLYLAQHLKLRLDRLRAQMGLSPLPLRDFVPSSVEIDWNRIEPADLDNLLRELLMQMGFQNVEWSKGTRDFDLVAEWPLRDPDGSEYRDYWLVSLGRNSPPELLLEELSFKPERILRPILGGSLRSERPSGLESGATVTILLIITSDQYADFDIERFRSRLGRLFLESRTAPSFRVRFWDRNHLASLVQKYPQLAYKYFSDEARSQSKFRKTPEQLYSENVDLAERQALLIAQLEDEKNKRIRAERDAAWKDISFSAAHKMGNPIFAIETNLDPLARRVAEQRTAEAEAVITNIRTSVEKAKRIVDQFKSLTRAQEIRPARIALKPVLQDASLPASNSGVTCDIACEDSFEVLADRERLAECFDELVANALHWLDKPEKHISISVSRAGANLIPGDLDSGQQYARIDFRDNGPGIPGENKQRIFDAFFTTYQHGTGLGLALVRRIIEGHGGTIWEQGLPGEGAEFVLYLPLPKTNGNGVQLEQQPDLPFDGEGE